MMTATIEANKRVVLRVFEEGFNAGNLAVVDELVSVSGNDHQHPDEPSFPEHLKDVIRTMREAFPDLHFDITAVVGEGDWVALHSVMTGTHTGVLSRPLAPRDVLATGRTIRVPHMHMIRVQDGQGVELLHLMDTFAMLNQLGLLAPQPATSV
jgi:predicted ester cyclase